MNELSERLRTAIEFVKRNGYANNDVEIARSMGLSASALNMAKWGRTPSWDLLLRFCDLYPISFEWIRRGTGSMVKTDRERMLLERIEQLEKTIAELKK